MHEPDATANEDSRPAMEIAASTTAMDLTLEALRKKSRELETIIETMAEGVALLDRDDRYVLLNAAGEHILNTPREQIIGRILDDEPWKRTHADGTPLTVEELPLARLRQGEDHISGWEVDLLLPDNQRRSLEVNFAALRDAEGGFTGTVATFTDITARKRIEEGLRRSEQLKAATFAAALDAIVSVDHEGNVIEFNPAAERCFGFSRKDIIGKAMVELMIPPALRVRHREGFRRYVETGESRVLGQRLALPALRADGTEIEIELAIIRLPGTNPPVFTAFARDVTDVKRAEQAVRLSQERLERALDSSRLALFEVDVATGDVYLSEGWAEIMGAEKGETHTTIAELLKIIHPDEREMLREAAREAMAGTRESYDVEHRVQRRDGEWIWILSRSHVVERDATGKGIRMAGTNVDLTERKRTEQRLHYMATRDSLTDLTNRALFGDDLQKAIAAATAQSRRVALISVGLDRFTTINDSLGQHVGDTILKAVADRLNAAVGSGDTVARPGGDEFLVLMPRIETSHDVAACAENILAAISKPIAVAGQELVVTASVGIALFPDDGDSAGLLLRNADIALHNAKSAGRDNVQFFTERMNTAARNRLEIEAALRQGLARDEFVIHYQPQIELSTGAIIGYEALVRWQRPEHGLVSPADFIPVAESTGLIISIGERILSKACHQAAAWQRIAGIPVRMAVNVTARQFRHKGFVKSLKGALAAAALDPRLLELEITEDAIMEHGAETIATLDAIGHMGVQLAIDDFGTGYSSLSYLKRLPIDTVKIDQSFVADLPGDPDAGAIVGAIIALAHNLGLKVLAEGVENRAQFEYLRTNGCDSAQGFFFGRPQPPELISVGSGGNVVFLDRKGAA